MGSFFQNLHINRTSFFLGFFTGILFWWLLGRARPWLAVGFHKLREYLRLTRESLTASTEIRLRNDILIYSQTLHLASPLFSLDEIVITPRLLAPPVPVEPGVSPPAEDIVATTVPYLPDWPDLAATYGAPTLTLPDALQGDANLVIIGHHGSGKTVALAHLASLLARQDPILGKLKSYVPLLIHAADLALPPRNPEDILESLKDSASPYTSTLTQARLLESLTRIFTNGQVLMMLDGMDELPPDQFTTIVEYIKQLIHIYPKTRFVVTATPEFYDGLTDLGFMPLSMGIWNENQQAAFLGRWADLWRKYVNQQSGGDEQVNWVLLNAWLMSDKTPVPPLDFTLKVWSTYAGDLLGPSLQNSIDAYLRRMSTGISKGRPAMEELALQALISQKPYFTQKEAQTWVSEFDSLPEPMPVSEMEEPGKYQPAVDEQRGREQVHLSRLVSSLLDSGLLLQHRESKLGFSHPLILSYLAGCALRASRYTDELLNQSNWAMRADTIGFMAGLLSDSPMIDQYIEECHEPLYRELIAMSRWLPYAPETAQWRTRLMRPLASLLQDDAQPVSVRARVLSAIARSGGSGVGLLFRQLIASADSSQRQIGALGCGHIREIKAIDDLNLLLKDSIPSVSRAASLALVAIGNRQALEYVADALLTGEEEIRRSAAQALANHPEEGFPTLKEAAAIDDLLVRKAAIAGLQRVNQPWSLQLIEDLHLKDEQWVVKDAAAQAIKELALPNSRIPKQLPPLVDTPWLIAFAGEKGIGVAPGKAAWELLMRALREGNDEQRLAALYYLSLHDYTAAVFPIYQLYYGCDGEIRNAAYDTLWCMASAGVEMPLPVQFGLGAPA